MFNFFPLVGMLVDTTKNYRSAFYSCAAGMLLAVVFLSLVRPCKTAQHRRETQPVEEVAATPLQDVPEDFIESDLGKNYSVMGCDSVV